MTQDQDLKKLTRRELLEVLLAQSRENDALRRRVTALEERLRGRELEMSEIGNLAEAALRLNGVFAAAQAAADQYVENVRESCACQLSLARAEAEKLRREAEQAAAAAAEGGSGDGANEPGSNAHDGGAGIGAAARPLSEPLREAAAQHGIRAARGGSGGGAAGDAGAAGFADHGQQHGAAPAGG